MKYSEERWNRRWRRGNLLAQILVVSLLCLVIGVQFAMNSEVWREKLQLGSHYTGEVVDLNRVAAAGVEEDGLFAYLEFSLQDYSSLSMAAILVNGKQVGVFSERELRIQVHDGDKIEFDAARYNQAITIKLVRRSENIRANCLLESVVAKGGRVLLGYVAFK